MAEFSQIDSSPTIPFSGAETDEYALGLSNPDSTLTGTQRGQQALGAPNIKTDSANQRIVVNDNSNNRVSFGRIGTGVNDWGLKVSKSTFSVDTATADQLIFSSSQNTFKIANIVTYAYTVTATDAANAYALFAVPHGLTIRPTVIGSFYRSSDLLTRPIPFTFRAPSQSYYTTSAPGGVSHIGSASLEVYSIDDTNINIQVNIFDINGLSWLLAGVVFNFKLYCLQETVIAA